MTNKEKVRVLHLVTRMNVGGVAVLLDNLMSNMDQSHFDSLLVSGICELPEVDYLSGKPVSYQVRYIPTFHKSISFIHDIKSIFKIARVIREFKPHIIHTHTSKAGLYGRLIALLVWPRAKRIHTFHGHLLFGYFNKPKLQLVLLFEKALALITTKFIAMGTQVKTDLIRVNLAKASKFEVFFPGLAAPNFPSRRLARNQLGLDESKIYCLFIGRLTGIKRPDRILDVARKLRTEWLELEFLIAGDGDLSEALLGEVKNEKLPVKFLGWRSDIAELLAASDLLLLTSDNEAVALTLIEAAQAGIPVVTTNAGSVRDIAIDGVTGFVTDFDPDELSEAVSRLVSDKELRLTMGDKGRKLANEKFSIEKMVSAHQDFYKELLRMGGSTRGKKA